MPCLGTEGNSLRDKTPGPGPSAPNLIARHIYFQGSLRLGASFYTGSTLGEAAKKLTVSLIAVA